MKKSLKQDIQFKKEMQFVASFNVIHFQRIYVKPKQMLKSEKIF